MKNLNLNFKNIHEWPLITRILIIGLICAVVFYLGYWWDVSNLNERLVNTEHQEQDIKDQLKLVITKEEKTKSDLSQFAKLEKLLKQWQNTLINYSELPEILNQILKIGATNHLYFSQFNPAQEVKEEQHYLKVPIKVVVVGSYHQIADFISQVANLPWIVVVGDFTISKENKNDVLGSKLAERANAENLLTAELTLEVYHLADKSVLKK